MPTNKLIFLHIPKTGGTTWHNILKRNFSQEEQRLIILPKDLEAINCLSAEQKSNLKLVRGHFYYGIHELFSEASTYITIVRDPFSRLVSHYNFILHNKKHVLNKLFIENKISLATCLENGLVPNMDNTQVRFISGILPDYGKVNQSHLNQAFENIKSKFSIIAPFDRYDECIFMTSELFGHTTPYYAPLNINHNKKKSLSDKELELIDKYTYFDRQLYTYVCRRFDQQISNLGEPFKQRVKKFQSNNKKLKTLIKLRRFFLRQKDSV